MNQVLNQDEFAAIVAKRIEIPATNTLEFDKDNFCLVLKDSAGTAVLTYNLGNFYGFYSEDPEKLEEIIAKIRQLNFSDLDWTNYDKIAPLLMPAIRDRAAYELSWAELARDHGEAAGALVHSAVCDVLSLFPIVDVGLSQARIPSSQFDQWSVSFDEVFERAQQNLFDKTTELKFSAISDEGTDKPSVFQSAWGDDYDAFRALANDWSMLEVKGEQLFLLLTPSMFLVWGSEDKYGWDYALSKLAIAQDPENAHIRPLPPFVLHRRDGKMAIYKPDSVLQPALHQDLKLHQAKYFMHVYDWQKNLLDSLPEIHDEGIFVANYVAVQSKDSQTASVCSWTEGVDSLLPKADFIIFIKLDTDGDNGDIVARARWDDAVAILPDQIEQKKYFPYRYETKGFPTAAQLQRLGMCEIF